jgi:F0F1-type ATP synthase assembly protein I
MPDERMPEEQPDPHETGQYFALAQAGLEMVAPLVIGAVIDYAVGWGPWLTVIGTIVGFVGGTIHLIMMAQRIERERKRHDRHQDGS